MFGRYTTGPYPQPTPVRPLLQLRCDRSIGEPHGTRITTRTGRVESEYAGCSPTRPPQPPRPGRSTAHGPGQRRASPRWGRAQRRHPGARAHRRKQGVRRATRRRLPQRDSTQRSPRPRCCSHARLSLRPRRLTLDRRHHSSQRRPRPRPVGRHRRVSDAHVPVSRTTAASLPDRRSGRINQRKR